MIGQGVFVKVADGPGVFVMVGEKVCVKVKVFVGVKVGVGEKVGVKVRVGVGDPVLVKVLVDVNEGVLVEVGAPVLVDVPVTVAVGVPLGVKLGVMVGVGEGEEVGVLVPVSVGVALWVKVEVFVAVAVMVKVAVIVGLLVGVGVTVKVLDGVGVGDKRQGKLFRSRKLSRYTKLPEPAVPIWSAEPDGMMKLTVLMLTGPKADVEMKSVAHELAFVEPWMVAGGDWQLTMMSLLLAVTEFPKVSETMTWNWRPMPSV